MKSFLLTAFAVVAAATNAAADITVRTCSIIYQGEREQQLIN